MLNDFQHYKFTHYFYLWDSEKSGFLTLENFAQLFNRIIVLKSLTPDMPEYQTLQQNTSEIWDGIVQYADTNNDGKVSLAEFLVYCEHALPHFKQMAATNAPTPMGHAIFTLMDTDYDGEVVAEDWGAFLQAWGIVEDAAEHFALMDVNGDGKISYDEFTRLCYVWGYSDTPKDIGNFLFGRF
jgi:Ca2+-binding EF-hand superfamily protein